jgi:TPR repeat protein
MTPQKGELSTDLEQESDRVAFLLTSLDDDARQAFDKHIGELLERQREAADAVAVRRDYIEDAVRLLAQASVENESPRGSRPPTSPANSGSETLAENLSRVAPADGEWAAVAERYTQALRGGRQARRALESLRDRAVSDDAVGILAKYLAGKVLRCPVAMPLLGQAPDPVAAAELWIGAASHGLAFALVGLGNMSRDGEVCVLQSGAADIRLAQRLWQAALAQCEVPEASFNLGVCAAEGLGSPVDLVLAQEHFAATRAALERCPATGGAAALLAFGPNNKPQAAYGEYAAKGAESVAARMAAESSARTCGARGSS